MKLLREHIRNLLLEYGASDEVVIDVSLDDIEAAYSSGKSDGDIRGAIMQDVPLYRVVDDLGLSKIRETGKVTPGDWAAPAESEKGAQFGFDLDDVVQFGLAQNKPRWFRHDDPKTGELGPKTDYPGRLRGSLWVLEVNAAFTPFYTMSYSGREKIVGPVNPFAKLGDKKYNQETHDLIQTYLTDKSKESADILRKHLSRLNLRLSKKGCDTGLGCSIDVSSSDIIKTYRVDRDDSGGYDLVPMAITDALRDIEDKDVSHELTPFDAKESVIREYIRSLLTEAALGPKDLEATPGMMKTTKRRLRRLIREQIEDERDDTWEKIMKLFFDNANHGIATAEALGGVDQQFIDNMIKLRDAGTAIVDSAKQGGPNSTTEEDNLASQWYKAYLDVSQRSRRFSDDVEDGIGQIKDLFQGAQRDIWYLSYPHNDPWPTTGDLADLVEWSGAEMPK